MTTETPISREAVELVADAISQSATLGNSGDGDVWLDNSMEIAQAAISALLASGEVVLRKDAVEPFSALIRVAKFYVKSEVDPVGAKIIQTAAEALAKFKEPNQ